MFFIYYVIAKKHKLKYNIVMKKIENKVILITGGSSGIGLALAEKLNKNNTVITIGLEQKQQENYYACDISDFSQVQAVIQDIAKKHKQIDIVINCAGYGMSGATQLIDIQQQKRMMDVNLFGIVNVVQNILSYVSQTAKIINVSSASGLFCVPFRTMYATTKCAVNMLTFGLRMELSNTKIQLTSICPCNIKTNFTANRVKDFKTNALYGNSIEKSTLALDSKEHKRMSVEKATKQILRIISKKKFKPYYIIGTGIKLLNFFARFVPKSLVEKITISTLKK